MRCIYDGLGGGHRGEYTWACSECGYEDWWASYDDPNKLGIQCNKCDEVKAKKAAREAQKLAEIELKERAEYERLRKKYASP